MRYRTFDTAMSKLFLDIDWRFFDREFMGERIANLLWFAGIIILTLTLKKPVANLLSRISGRLATRVKDLRKKDVVGTMLVKPIERLLQTVLYFVAVNQLENLLDRYSIKYYIGKKQKVNLKLDEVLEHVFLFFFIIFLTQVITRFIDYLYYVRMSKASQEKNLSRMQLLPLMKEMAKLAAWTLSVFWILGSVFHVNVPALITGLGIGGVAIALAGKETVENFFAAFTILSDRPFQTGDTVKIGDTEGVVERIGFRSTRLRNTDGAAYIVPNQNLVSQNLLNLSARDTRGLKLVANIKYGISHENLQTLIARIREELAGLPFVKDPVEANIEIFDKETFQLVISYHVPHPMPGGMKLTEAKREVNMKVFALITEVASIGTPVGTS